MENTEQKANERYLGYPELFKEKSSGPIHSPQGNTTKEGSISSPEDTSKEEFCLSDEITLLPSDTEGREVVYTKDVKKAVKLLKEEFMIIKEFIDKIFGKDLI